ncbi:YbaK family protein [Evansella sp. LMS18]|uniref:DUF2521 family protein n=1 Tax=Evansella sp. LMS18 TaxID=2924033 RepID=UPI0020D12545|nr:DUF2521 family protein [Evansella sp. LMS18]UTR12554.1 YbaK family protein [Evansella sp. LMS18]
MNVVYNLGERRRKKQWKFERSMLRSLSIHEMRKDAERTFFSGQIGETVGTLYLMDFCLDIGIDAYLLGSEYARFGYFGETPEQAEKRCEEELDALAGQTASQFTAWYTGGERSIDEHRKKSSAFIKKWWKKGFTEGEKKYRLRLH